MSTVSILAVILAALSSFALGGLWYSTPVFGSAWRRAAGGPGAGVVAASFGINYQFANRPAVLWLIDGGYHTVQFTIYGLILGLWR